MSLLIYFVLSGCAQKWVSDSNGTQLTGPGHISKFKNSEDEKNFAEIKTLYQKRYELKTLNELIQKLEKLNERNPDIYEVLVMLCELHKVSAEHQMLGLKEISSEYAAAAKFADKALMVNTAYYQRIKSKDGTQENSLELLNLAEIEALYCSAMNQARWSRSVSFATFQKMRKKAQAMIERVNQLNPNYKYGAYHRYRGWEYAVSPFYAGGNLSKSQVEYNKAIKINNHYIANDVELAEFYAVKKKDKELFVKHLELALKKDPYALNSELADQILMQRKAKKLLDQKDQYFKK